MVKNKRKTAIIILSVWIVLGVGIGEFLTSTLKDLDCSRVELDKATKESCVSIEKFSPYTVWVAIAICTVLGIYCYRYTVNFEEVEKRS
jgi:hypothetical protein